VETQYGPAAAPAALRLHLLLAGYEGMKHRGNAIPPEGKLRFPEALESLIA
jgi:hypothetical protein